MDQAQYAVPCLRGDIDKAHSHSRTKRVLVGFRADPSDDPLRRKPFAGILRQRKLHRELGSDSQRSSAFDEQPAAADSARSALELGARSEEHTSELQSPKDLVCRLL